MIRVCDLQVPLERSSGTSRWLRHPNGRAATLQERNCLGEELGPSHCLPTPQCERATVFLYCVVATVMFCLLLELEFQVVPVGTTTSSRPPSGTSTRRGRKLLIFCILAAGIRAVATGTGSASDYKYT